MGSKQRSIDPFYDFPAERACDTVAELLRACPEKNRMTACDRLLEALADLAPDWHEMISRAADRWLHGE